MNSKFAVKERRSAYRSAWTCSGGVDTEESIDLASVFLSGRAVCHLLEDFPQLYTVGFFLLLHGPECTHV